jgi:hypothetical protein
MRSLNPAAGFLVFAAIDGAAMQGPGENGFVGETKPPNTILADSLSVAPSEKKESDYWAAFEGIPLCHTPETPEEWAELDKKGACRCG